MTPSERPRYYPVISGSCDRYEETRAQDVGLRGRVGGRTEGRGRLDFPDHEQGRCEMGRRDVVACEPPPHGQPHLSRHGGVVADVEGSLCAGDERNSESRVLAAGRGQAGQETDFRGAQKRARGEPRSPGRQGVRTDLGFMAASADLHRKTRDRDQAPQKRHGQAAAGPRWRRLRAQPDPDGVNR